VAALVVTEEEVLAWDRPVCLACRADTSLVRGFDGEHGAMMQHVMLDAVGVEQCIDVGFGEHGPPFALVTPS